jgi:hypothetical protein
LLELSDRKSTGLLRLTDSDRSQTNPLQGRIRDKFEDDAAAFNNFSKVYRTSLSLYHPGVLGVPL